MLFSWVPFTGCSPGLWLIHRGTCLSFVLKLSREAGENFIETYHRFNDTLHRILLLLGLTTPRQDCASGLTASRDQGYDGWWCIC